MSLVNWLVEGIVIEKCRVKPCYIRLMVKGEVLLMLGFHVDIILSGLCGVEPNVDSGKEVCSTL